jgi:hypothetical protein
MDCDADGVVGAGVDGAVAERGVCEVSGCAVGWAAGRAVAWSGPADGAGPTDNALTHFRGWI